MSAQRSVSGRVRVHVRNIGGIDESTVTFDDGVTVLAGRNATNRTSFLRATMAALGSDDVSLKGDADEGRVELVVGDETYTRTLSRRGAGVALDGDPYLDDSETADLFAFLLERNEAREAVRRGGDLRDSIMRPVDTESIRAEIDELSARKRELDDRLDELETLRGRLPDLERERTRLREEIDETEAELAATEESIDEMDASVEEASEEDDELDRTLSRLGEIRSDLESVRYDIDSETRGIEALAEERDELEERAADLDPVEDDAEERIEAQLRELRREHEGLQSVVSELQSVIRYNEELLSGTGNEVAEALGGGDHDHGDGSPTDLLVDDDGGEADDTVVCWTCGTAVDRDAIEGTLDRLRSLRSRKRERVREVDERIESLEAERSTVERRRTEHERIERELERVERERSRREDRRTELRERREELEARVEELETRVEELEREGRSELLDRHREANELEFELGRLKEELSAVEEEIAGIEAELDTEESVADERERVADELAERRTRIERTEADAVDRFNEHMDEVLAVLEYDNLDRIWIERVASDGPEGRFDLHVVRRTDGGTAYEDVIDHLSESEREVIGLTFALAGYLTHDLHETVPVILLDSLEAIDSERVADLVAYFSDYVPYLLVALLPEDARALPEAYARLDGI